MWSAIVWFGLAPFVVAYRRVQVNEDRPWDIFSASRLVEKGVEAAILTKGGIGVRLSVR